MMLFLIFVAFCVFSLFRNECKNLNDKEGDRDYEADIKQDLTVPQRVTRSKNNIYKKNKKYDEDYV